MIKLQFTNHISGLPFFINPLFRTSRFQNRISLMSYDLVEARPELLDRIGNSDRLMLVIKPTESDSLKNSTSSTSSISNGLWNSNIIISDRLTLNDSAQQFPKLTNPDQNQFRNLTVERNQILSFLKYMRQKHPQQETIKLAILLVNYTTKTCVTPYFIAKRLNIQSLSAKTRELYGLNLEWRILGLNINKISSCKFVDSHKDVDLLYRWLVE